MHTGGHTYTPADSQDQVNESMSQRSGSQLPPGAGMDWKGPRKPLVTGSILQLDLGVATQMGQTLLQTRPHEFFPSHKAFFFF